MSGNPNSLGIVGIDGVTPISYSDSKWTMWSLHEIYRGQEGENKYIPKVNDYVMEPETGITYIVVSLDPINLVPELALVTIKQSYSKDELLSTTSDNYRVYYDKSTTPYTLSVDGFMHTYSMTASFARIYKGSDLDPTKIISRTYDNSGNFLGHDVNLTLVSFNSHDNYGIKSVSTCNCDVDLVDGEDVSVVIFDSNGKVLTKANCIIEETTFVSQAYAEQKYITQIFLKSVFVEATQTNQISYPVNLPVRSFNPIGVVQYNDGTQEERVIDGDKFKLLGLDTFVSTIVGHKVPLVLSYRLDANESALANVNTDGFFVTRPYELVVSRPNKSYNVKMFVYPQWVDEVTGYNYKVFMMNLDRNILYDITNVTSIANNSPSLIPNAYGVTQRITFTVDLASVSNIYSTFIHVQTVDIVLRGRANDDSLTNIWEVGSEVPSATPYYGGGLRAKVSAATSRRVSVGNNLPTVEDFLNETYYKTNPLYNPTTEQEPLVPTHMEIRSSNETILVPIEDYDKEVVFNDEAVMYSNVDVIFYRETVGGYLKLSIVSMTVR